MIPKKLNQEQRRLFEKSTFPTLSDKHPLMALEKEINWNWIEKELVVFYKQKRPGYPPIPIRLLVALTILQYMKKLSDPEVLEYFFDSFYVQYFCGYRYPQWKKPINACTLVRFRQRIGAEGANKILQISVQVAINTKTVSKKEMKKVIADTTVMPKNIAHPTDSTLLNKARKKMVAVAKKEQVPLRQNYNRLAKKKLIKVGRYAHAKQFKRMRKSAKSLKTYTGRVARDIERKIFNKPKLVKKFMPILLTTKKLLTQTKTSKNKIYSIHEPHVYCLAKGKARKPYEFGTKVSFVCTQKKGIVLAAQALEKNVHDAASLRSSIELSEKITATPIKRIFVDKGYRGHSIQGKEVYIAGQKRGVSAYLKRQMRKRSIIEGTIGHMKEKSKLNRSMLHGIIGDKVNAIFCAIAHNFKMTINNNYFIFYLFLSLFYFYQTFFMS